MIVKFVIESTFGECIKKIRSIPIPCKTFRTVIVVFIELFFFAITVPS